MPQTSDQADESRTDEPQADESRAGEPQADESRADEPQVSKPQGQTARVHVLQDGYVRSADDGEHVGSTVTLITDGDVVVVVDPGMVSSRQALLAALAQSRRGTGGGDRCGVQPPPPGPYGQRGAVPGREDP